MKIEEFRIGIIVRHIPTNSIGTIVGLPPTSFPTFQMKWETSNQLLYQYWAKEDRDDFEIVNTDYTKRYQHAMKYL